MISHPWFNVFLPWLLRQSFTSWFKSSGPDTKSIKSLWLNHSHKGHPWPFFAPSYCHGAHMWTKFTQSYTYGDKVTVPHVMRLSIPSLSQPRRPSMFQLHHGLLISCDLLLCRGGHPFHQLHPGGLHFHSLRNAHIILHGDNHCFTATAPRAMVSSSAPWSRPR